MRTGLAGLTALGVCMALAGNPTPVASATAAPDFSGLWVRVGNLWFDPVPDDTVVNDQVVHDPVANELLGKPVDRLKVAGPDAENIWAGDANNPVLLPWAREAVRRNAEAEIRREHVYTADDSCWPSGVPQVVNLLEEVQFLQTKEAVIILYQRDHQVRWIWLDRPHTGNPRPSWYGESVGHYEGDTLVVDTIGLKSHKMSVVDAFGTPHTDQLHVEERYELFSTPFGNGLEITVRVEDPGAFRMPWKGTAEYRQNTGATQFREVVCAENNRSFGQGSTFGTIPEERVSPF